MKCGLLLSVLLLSALMLPASGQIPRAEPVQPANSGAAAQGQGGQVGPPGSGGASLGLPRGMDFLRAYCETVGAPFCSRVQKALELSSAQVVKIAGIQEGMTRGATSQEMLEERRRVGEAVLLQLTPPQAVRYEEISLQYQGALCALLRPSIAEVLGLSESQRLELEQMYLLYRKSIERVSANRRNRLNASRADGAGMVQVRAAVDVLAETVLTPRQQERLRQLRGRPLNPRPVAWSQSVPLP